LPAHNLPSVIENLPSGLVSHGIQTHGLHVDGWLAATSSFALSQPSAPAELVVQGKVPLVDDEGFTTELLVLIDGRETVRTILGTGRFAIRTPVEDGPARRLVELRFSDVQRLLAPDIRLVGAYTHRIGFEAAPAAQPAPLPPTPPPDIAPMPAAPLQGAPPPTPEAASPSSRPPAMSAPAGDAEAAVASPAAVPHRSTLPPPPARIFAAETVFGPEASPLRTELQELWRYRHLFRALVWRNVRIEFDATRLGSLWAIARPILFAVVFGFFRNLSGANTYVDIPYIPYLFSGLLLWTYFTDVATNTASAIRSDLALLTKVYYPRLLTPLVPAVSNLLTLIVGMVPLAAMMVWMGLRPGWMLALLPVVVLPCIILALGIGLLVSSLSVENRDWERVLAYSLTIGLWLSPVIYAPEMIPEGARALYHLNPMVGPLLAFRAVLVDGVPFPLWEWVYGALVACVTFALGLRVFRRTEVRLVDRL